MDYSDITTREPQSRVEAWLKEIYEHGGGGGGDDPANTASEEDIEGIEDQIWPDQNDQTQTPPPSDDPGDEETASNEDINGIIDDIWSDGGEG